MELKDLQTILPPHTPGTLATIDQNGNPDIRGFEWQGVIDDKIVLITSNNKNVFKQIQANSNVAFFAMSDKGMVRVYGKAVQVVDEQLVQKVHANCAETVKQFYPTPKDNGFAVLQLTNGKATVASYGVEPQTVKF